MGGTFSSNPSTASAVTESQENQRSPSATESQENQGSPVGAPGPDEKPKKKICCACPETKKLRDECIVTNGEAACSKLIEAHLTCLRAEGFNV